MMLAKIVLCLTLTAVLVNADTTPSTGKMLPPDVKMYRVIDSNNMSSKEQRDLLLVLKAIYMVIKDPQDRAYIFRKALVKLYPSHRSNVVINPQAANHDKEKFIKIGAKGDTVLGLLVSKVPKGGLM